MKKVLKKKIVAWLSLFLMLFQNTLPLVVYAQEVSPSPESIIDPSPAPEPEPTPNPDSSPTPTPESTPEPSANPSPAPTSEPTIESSPIATSSAQPSPSPTSTPNQNNNESSNNQSNENNQSSSPNEVTPEPTASPTPTPVPEDLHEQLQAIVLENSSAVSVFYLDLDVNETGSAVLSTDKPDYAPTDTALITGIDFEPNAVYTITISSSDEPATSTTVEVTADENGELLYAYQLDGVYRPNYKVEARDQNGILVATITFTDSVTVVPATGGINISVDKAQNGSSPSFTTLGNMVITEIENSDLPANQSGTSLILTAPSNWTFNPGEGSVAFAGGNDVTSTSILVTSSIITVTLSTDGQANKKDTITVSGIQVRATDGALVPSAGNILRTSGNPGTATITGIVNDTTNFGSLSQGISATPTPTPTPSPTPTSGQPSASLEQCRNGSAVSPNNCTTLGGGVGWVNGNAGSSNSHYVEGLSIPYRTVMQNLPLGTPITLTLEYDIKHSGAHAIDFLTHFNRLQPHSPFGHNAESIDPTSGVSGLSATISTYAIPAPSSVGSPVAGQPTTRFNSLPAGEKLMTLFGGTITDIAYDAQGDLNGSNTSTSINVTFTVDSANAVLSWGGHIGREIDWGTNMSAGGISGSPYHMRLIDWNLNNLGNQDRSLSADAIAPPSSITIIKDAQPNNSQDFIFTTTGNGLTNFSLDDDADGTLSNTTTFSSLLEGTFTITESQTPGWSLSSANCVSNGAQESLFTSIANGVSIDLVAGEDIICTFTNIQQTGSITVVKQTDPDGSSQSFDFTLGGDGNGNTSLTDGGFHAFENLPVGTYSLSESPISGWVQTSAVCSDGSPINAITLGDGEDVVCTFTNTQNSSITVVKSVVNNNGGSAVVADFPLFINDTQVTSGVSNPLATGVYTISETQQPGYTQTSIVCDNNKTNPVTLNPGDSVTCTITNDDNQSYIIVDKTVVNDNGGVAQPNDFLLTVDGAAVSDGVAYPVNPGTYTVSETNLPGYTAGVWGTDCSTNGSVTVALGETKTCTITNDDVAPTITLIKEIVGSDANEPDDFNLTIGGSIALSGQTYQVNANENIALNETVLLGYTFTSLTGDEECPNELGGTVNLEVGESITCTITNTRDRGGLIVRKIIDVDGNLETTNDQSNGEDWEFSVNGNDGDTSDEEIKSTNASGSATFADLKTGSYMVAETLQDGYDLIFATCNQEEVLNETLVRLATTNVLVEKDETAVCTFYNSPNGTIHGYKWNDNDGDREVDENEEKLSGWTINLYRIYGEGESLIDTFVTDDSEEHFGWYWFEHLFPGNYKVCEVLQSTWEQTYPAEPSCHFITLPDENPNDLPEESNFIQRTTPDYNFGNRQVMPTLFLDKTNDATTSQSPGSDVLYTLTVTLRDNDLNGVKVTDLPPQGFKYRSGSWTAFSSVRGDLKVLGITTQPTYASPGTWQLGDMVADEVVTLTYMADVSNEQESGNYPDLAWSFGDFDSTTVYANEDTGKFVGTSVPIDTNPNPTSTFGTSGSVLGASTELPSTGANGVWLFIAFGLITTGFGLRKISRKYEN